MHRLADLSDRTALERERRGVDDRLVAVVQRVQSVCGVDRQPGFGCAEDRDPPVAGASASDEAADERGAFVRRADRIAGDDCDAADDAVGEERRLVVVEEVRLVGAEDERRQRVDAPGLDECRRQLPLALCLHDAMPPRCEPAADDPRRRRHAEQEEREREPVAERAAQVVGAVDVAGEDAAERLLDDEVERERLVGRHAVQPERRACVERERRQRDREPLEQQMPCRRVSRPVEVVAACEQQGEHDRRRERAVVEAVERVQCCCERGERRRDLPGSPPSPREAARRDQRADGDEDAGGVRQRTDGVRRQRVEQARVVAGQHGVQDVQHGSCADDGRDDERRAPPDAPARCEDRRRDGNEDGGRVDGLPA